MVSSYLNRPLRPRVRIAADLARTFAFTRPSAAQYADGIGIVFAVTEVSHGGGAVFVQVSGHCERLTGHAADALSGAPVSILQDRLTNAAEAQRLIADVREHGLSEVRLRNVRSDGALYGCHIAAFAPTDPADAAARGRLYAYLDACPLEACP
jgi:hypothetical protein